MIFAFAALILGAVVGSFINALSLRWGTGHSALRGRSRCMHCGHPLEALDLVPVFSYLFLRGRCRYCGSRLSAQYPLVEVAGALLVLGVYLLNPEPLFFCFWFLVWMVLLFVVVYDVRHQIIPYSTSIVLGLLALASLFFSGVPALWALLAGPVLAAPLLVLWLISGGRWMGFSDGLVELSLGWLLGLTAGGSALMLGVWSGAIVGIALLSFGKRFTMKSEIPLTPFLVLGALLAYFFHVDFFSTLSTLF